MRVGNESETETERMMVWELRNMKDENMKSLYIKINQDI